MGDVLIEMETESKVLGFGLWRGHATTHRMPDCQSAMAVRPHATGALLTETHMSCFTSQHADWGLNAFVVVRANKLSG